MPDGYKSSGVQSVIYQCSGDGAADTVKPRLMAAGTDCKKVAYILDEEEALTLDDTRIEEAIEKTGARLFILDPLQSFVPQDGDMHSAGRIRSLPGEQIIKFMENAGISECTVNKVKKKLGIKSFKLKNKWFWTIPELAGTLEGKGQIWRRLK